MNDNHTPTDFDYEPDIDFIEACKNGLRLVDWLGMLRVTVNPQTIAVMQPFEVL